MKKPAAETPAAKPESGKPSDVDPADSGKGIGNGAGEIKKSTDGKESSVKPSKELKDSSSGSQPK